MSQEAEFHRQAGESIHVEYRPHSDGGTRVAMLRHPTNPFRVSVGRTTASAFDKAAQNAANAYLQALAKVMPLTRYDALFAQLFSDAIAEDQIHLCWQSIGWSSAGLKDSRGSFWVERYNQPQRDPNVRNFLDRTLVLLATMHCRSEDAASKGKLVPQRVGRGLRVVAHLRAREGHRELHFVSFSASLQGHESGQLIEQNFPFDLNINLCGLNVGIPTSWRPHRFDAADPTVVTFTTVSQSNSARYPYSLTFFRTFTHNTATGRTSVVDQPMVTHATAAPQPVPPTSSQMLRMFSAHAAEQKSQGLVDARPSRIQKLSSSSRRAKIPIPPQTKTNEDFSTLEDNDGRFSVLYSDRALRESTMDPVAGRDGQSQLKPRAARLDTDANPLTDKFAAISAYRYTADLFKMLETNGFDASQYFSQYRLPLKVIPRSAIWPVGIDGNTINAQVNVAGNWEHPGVGSTEWTKARPQLEVRFAYANLMANRARRRTSTNQVSYERLGLATDPRWAWHEFGHVLIAATTGELELRFVHSVGDALAAIKSDPESSLTELARMRGVTFPWVALTRRHDRCAQDGWSWEGQMHRPSAFWVGGPNERSIKGYTTEQIMSSSLFMLYRALGGDTVDASRKPDRKARQEASDFVCYLIIRALALLGPASAVPADSVDQFVSALIDADIGTNTWRTRRGGAAHKVIAWAFEQQGLKAITRPVDLFIQSNGNAHGGYAPVLLDPKSRPYWHAHPHAVRHSNGSISVTVRNAGVKNAHGVTASAWVISESDGIKSANWVALTAQAPQPETISAAGEHDFSFDISKLQLTGNHWVFVSTTCPADPANNTVGTALPCVSTGPTLEAAVVSSDNNLALALVTF